MAKWFEVLTPKQEMHWCVNPRSGASWPEVWPSDLNTVDVPPLRRVTKKRKIRNRMARLSRRKNR